jgi:peptidyl-dipeptidase A
VPADLRRALVEQDAALQLARGRVRADFEGAALPEATLALILARELDGPRRQGAWRAARGIGDTLAPRIRALAHLRNERARLLGFPDHVALALHVSELDAGALSTLLGEVERETRPAYQRVKGGIDAWLARRYEVAAAALQPWHLPGRFLDRDPRSPLGERSAALPDLAHIEGAARPLFRGMGLPADDLWDAVDRTRRPGSPPLSACLPVAPPDDVRVMLAPAAGVPGLAAVLHELGHALYARHLPRDLPWSLREPAHDALGEGVAMLFERQARERPDDDAAVFLRWALVVVRFEQALYADPDGDLDGTWWDLVEALQEIPRPPGPDRADWAAEVHIASVPVYYQNYILGERIAARLGDHLGASLGHPTEERPGWLADPRAGDRLRALFRMGARYPLEETLRRWTEER